MLVRLSRVLGTRKNSCPSSHPQLQTPKAQFQITEGEAYAYHPRDETADLAVGEDYEEEHGSRDYEQIAHSPPVFEPRHGIACKRCTATFKSSNLLHKHIREICSRTKVSGLQRKALNPNKISFIHSEESIAKEITTCETTEASSEIRLKYSYS